MKKIFLFLTVVTMLLTSCVDNEPNHDRKDSKGEAFYAGESPALNVYDIEYEGYQFLVFKEIHDPNTYEKIVSVILDPRYEQKPIYRMTKTITIDTLRELDKPVHIELENPKKVDGTKIED